MPIRLRAALLEAMEEHTVTVDGITRPLPSPFVCIATQNPLGAAGTQPLVLLQLWRASAMGLGMLALLMIAFLVLFVYAFIDAPVPGSCAPAPGRPRSAGGPGA